MRGAPGPPSRTPTGFAMVAFLFASAGISADTEIHRCLLDDGTVAFQETPCPERAGQGDDKPAAGAGDVRAGAPADDDDFDFASPFDEPAGSASGPAPPEPASQSRAECEKTARDAIDAIDAELQKKAQAKEQAQEHLAQLLTLTEQLRACKQL